MSTVTVSEIPESAKFARGRGFKSQLLQLLQQGLEPQKMALALALGATIGVLPTIWGTSLLCVVASMIFRLNQVVVQLANYLVYPLQILLLVPYFKLGEHLFSSQTLPNHLENLPALMRSAPQEVVSQLWQANLQAMVVWLLTSPLLLASVFVLARLLVQRLRTSEAHDENC